MRRLKILLFVVLSLTATQNHHSMRSISLLIIHCSAVRPGQQSSAKDIDLWHRQRGWRMIGYHYVVRRNGTVEKGRTEETTGAHCVGHNAHSIGICYEGGLDEQGQIADTRTEEQKKAMAKLIVQLKQQFPTIRKVLGHRDLPGVQKACPCFDATTLQPLLHLK